MVRGGFDSTYVVTWRIVWLAVWHVRCGKGLQDKRYKPKENQKCKPQFEEMSTTLSCKSLQKCCYNSWLHALKKWHKQTVGSIYWDRVPISSRPQYLHCAQPCRMHNPNPSKTTRNHEKDSRRGGQLPIFGHGDVLYVHSPITILQIFYANFLSYFLQGPLNSGMLTNTEL